jgi:hypothetical protein
MVPTNGPKITGFANEDFYAPSPAVHITNEALFNQTMRVPEY